MKFKELTSQISEKLSLPKKTVRDVVDYYFIEIKNSIESGDDNKVIFKSPVLKIRRRIKPKDEEKNTNQIRRGIIIIKNKKS